MKKIYLILSIVLALSVQASGPKVDCDNTRSLLEKWFCEYVQGKNFTRCENAAVMALGLFHSRQSGFTKEEGSMHLGHFIEADIIESEGVDNSLTVHYSDPTSRLGTIYKAKIDYRIHQGHCIPIKIH